MARIEDALRSGCSQDPTGTHAAKYSPAKDGPFRCDGCTHYAEKDSCNHPVLMADEEMTKNEHGDAVVDDGGCCMYFRKKGKSNG
jgi:hypothetical protein